MAHMLTVLDSLPDRFLDLPAERLHEILNGPTLIHLTGKRERPLFISVLLHGNEVTGVGAIQQLIRKYETLPRAISLLIGNVKAARHGTRRLDDQPDYNRIWKCDSDNPESVMARKVIKIMEERNPFAAVDIHNNTGFNPHYSCVTTMDQRSLFLGSLFDRKVVYFTKPDTTLTYAFSSICPAVTVECGTPGQNYGANHATDFLEECVRLSQFPTADVHKSDLNLYHSMAIIKPANGINFDFSPKEADLSFPENIDHNNFRSLPPGTVFGTVAPGIKKPLDIRNEKGEEVSDEYIEIIDGEIRLRKEVMPSMLTLNKKIIQQDCLCYFMEVAGPQPVSLR